MGGKANSDNYDKCPVHTRMFLPEVIAFFRVSRLKYREYSILPDLIEKESIDIMKIISWTGIILLVLVAAFVMSCSQATPKPAPAPAPAPSPTSAPALAPGPKTYSAPPAMTIDTSKKYTALMETEKGTIVLELFAKDVPKTVNNFVFLATEGFYDGSTFHRVIPGFMAQGGDPTGTGMGSAGYRFEDEFTEHTHVAGVISMANSGANTNSSQFFITYAPQHGLDGKHSVFGQIIGGQDVLENLTPRDPSQNPQFEGDKIIKIEIIIE